ncbi:uncharacterized protein TRUGW13939_10635 [Talaromyces rugulosus]|uniref:Uncharacterized protein n=1 Tax=Talaromyces rugulosus TaxID=121627 RepID=A0A7H8RD66_TALRU|nr:uncharacterized protein TRUGW13939_10635 [Talaromyces rugulosus]QKX63465.1 hypothetical protein TRUGW13939_10635 [Talaromyces rugulosus]
MDLQPADISDQNTRPLASYNPAGHPSRDLESRRISSEGPLSAKRECRDQVPRKTIAIYIAVVLVGSFGVGIATCLVGFQLGFRLGEQLAILRDMGQ